MEKDREIKQLQKRIKELETTENDGNELFNAKKELQDLQDNHEQLIEDARQEAVEELNLQMKEII